MDLLRAGIVPNRSSQLNDIPKDGRWKEHPLHHNDQLMVNYWLGSRWFGFRKESPKMKGIGILGCTPRFESQTTGPQSNN